MATTTATLQNLAVEWGVQDAPAVIASLVKSTGILQTATVGKANYGNKHKYKRFNTLPAGTFRTFGTGVVPVALSKDMESLDLWEVVSYLQGDCREVDTHPGGRQGWYNANINAVLAGLGQSVSKQIIYGTELQTGTTYYSSQNGFLGLAQYNVANGQFTEIDTDNSYTGAQTSIHVVRWDLDTGASLRTPDNGQNLINVEFLGRQMVVTSTTTNAQYDAYTWKISTYMTLVVPDSTAAFMVCGFNNTNDNPTAPQIDNAIAQVMQGGAGNVYVYCNLKGYSAIQALKYAKGSIDIAVPNGINNHVTSWNGVPVVLDTNITSAEYAALYE